ncbi:MAG: SGNH/GDSL hydrolase family protein [Candidatus Eisenbacteria bacterium]
MTKATRGALAVSFVTTALCLLLAEWVIATLRPQMTMAVLLEDAPRIFRSSDVLPYQLVPNAESAHRTAEFSVPIRINSCGYRCREFDVAKGEQFRILVVGDSFTFGHGCTSQECYASALQRELEEALGPGAAEVINAGYASCYYPDTYYLYLKTFGLELDPDLVIVGFFVGNDVDRQGMVFNEWVEVDERGLPLRIASANAHVEDGYWVSDSRLLRYRYPILRNSHLFQAIVSVLRSSGAPAEGRYRNELMYRPSYAERTIGAVDGVKRLFTEMDAMTKASGAQFLVFSIPAIEQVEPHRFFDEEGADSSLDILKPQRLFGEFFEESGIDFVDPLPFLRSMSEESLYYPIDQHWTPAGNELAGRWLARRLLEMGAVPRPPVRGI